MSHTNSTTNYSLPQFLTTDKPAWLTDVNNAYLAIDTGMHNAQDAANTADSKGTQALLDAATAQSAANTADTKASGATASLADTFDNTATYAIGDIVIYNSLLYKCTVAITTPGDWTGTDNWTRTTIEEALRLLEVEIATKQDSEVTVIVSGTTITITRCGNFITVGLVGCPVSAIYTNLAPYVTPRHFRALCWNLTTKKPVLVSVGENSVRVLELDNNTVIPETGNDNISGGFTFMLNS